MQETAVQVTDGKEAKEKIAVLINELVKIVEGRLLNSTLLTRCRHLSRMSIGGGGLLRSVSRMLSDEVVAYALP